MSGSGFSASGVSKQFSFTGVVTGETETGDGETAEENTTDTFLITDGSNTTESENAANATEAVQILNEWEND